jgi:nitrogenase molybdenum-iron protein beta chain
VTGFETYLGNFRVLKRMMEQMAVPCSLLSDPSEVLDTPADGHYRMYSGGTTQQEMKEALTPSIRCFCSRGSC